MQAVQQGIWAPPHIKVQARVTAAHQPAGHCRDLAGRLEKLAAHLARIKQYEVRAARVGTNIFIGHGRSPAWRDLKDFVQDRLRVPYDEFNRVPVAGITNIARLSEMLDAAACAFVIMTGEDEQADGKVQARTNVIHEVGLFQGRLGFTKAIILLEEGCEEFSNIQGLGQIRFPKGNISAKFEEIRQVLEREGVIEAPR
jgi:predicted nucleotide-binding protein